ncbi:hypothetical protein AB1046_16130 [Promicromonospora sp. Populi]|uniref:hypothetical protein n=1 Tax=Promicromonospora sp. Populi TaxID=3239420 RepID=UPI0034E28BAC
MKTLPDAGRRPAALSVLALTFAAWLVVPLRLLNPGMELDLGFTTSNVVFVVENAAMMSTVVLAVGSAAVRARRLLLGAVAVAGVHLLFQVGTVIVQLAVGAQAELVLGTLSGILVLAVALAGLLIALRLRNPRSARWIGLAVALVGAVIHTLWTSALLPLVSMLPYGDLMPGLVGSLLLNASLGLLGVAAAALCGWAAPMARRIGALLAAMVGLLGIMASVVALGAFGGGYAAVQVLQGLLMLTAVVFAVLAARRLVAARRLAAAAVPDTVAAET